MTEGAMRIALLGPAPPFRGGITQFALMLAQEYQLQGNEVRMFSFHRQYPQLLFPGGKQTAVFSALPEIVVERLFTPYQPQTWSKAVNSIQSWQPDIVIVSYFLPWFAPSYAWICQRLSGSRIICLAHNVDFHEHWPGADLLSRRLFYRCNRIVLLSQACKQDLSRKFPGPIADKAVTGFHPIYDCYQNSAQPEKTLEPSAPTLLFFGLIKPYKGLDILLRAVKQAQKRIPELRLIVAGEVYGSPRRYLELIRRLGLGDTVELHFRYIPEAEIGAFFGRCHACVLPYTSATQSGVIATAYSFNKPVIASRVGGLGEYVSEGETGLLVEPNSPEALTGAIVRLFELGLERRMRDNIPAYKKRFSWSRLADLILDT